MMRSLGVLAALAALTVGAGFVLKSATRVGETSEQGVWTPTGQWAGPAGRVVEVAGRPMDVVLVPGRSEALVKTTGALLVLDVPAAKIKQTLSAQGGSSMSGLAVDEAGNTALFSNAGGQVLVARRQVDGAWAWSQPIALPAPKVGGSPHPCGIALLPGRTQAVVAMTRANAIALVDYAAAKVLKVVPTAVCPYGAAVSPDGARLVVSCWSREARAGEEVQPSSGTDVPVTKGGAAREGRIELFSLPDLERTASLATGLQPTDVAFARNGMAYCALGGSDAVAVVDAVKGRIARTIPVRIGKERLLGTAPNGLALSPDGRRLYAGCGGVNAVAVIRLVQGMPSAASLEGWIPAGWHPGGLAAGIQGLAACSIKGRGSRAETTDAGRDAYDWLGTLSLMPEPSAKELEGLTAQVMARAALEEMEAARRRPRPGAAAKTVPDRAGEPSLIKHVVYILKENRTYDQVFGDIPMGVRDPKLCLFPEEVTPNHHALAMRFGLLDNYYCNGVLSADGHAWSVEGNATPYFERSFGGWTRSYPFGDDPLAVSASGFVWDEMIRRGISFRNFGEFDYAEPANKESFKQVYDDFVSGRNQIKFTHKIGVAQLRRHTDPDFPGWNMGIPDVLRADRFLKAFRKMEAKGEMPRFTLIYLPQDHHSGSTPGMPTPRAHLADNDLALGRVVEALSKSKFWPQMAIFVNEDDPGGGFDSVDGHRSICLVISPYSTGGLQQEFYNQTSVLATMQRILGLPPTHQHGARSPLMGGALNGRFDPRPYTHLPARIALDELNPTPSAGSRLALDLSGPDRVDERAINLQLWEACRPGKPFPAGLVGAHGKGLAARGLRQAAKGEEPEEDDD